MADIPRIQIIAEVDERASASRIEAQLPSISKQVNERVKVGLEIDQNNIAADTARISRQINSTVKAGTGRITIPVGIDIQTDTLKRQLAIQSDTLKKTIAKTGASLDWSKFNQNFERGTLESLRQAKKELSILQDQYRNFDAGIAKILPKDAIENLNKYISDTTSKTADLHAKFNSLKGGIPQEAIDQFAKLSALQKEMSLIPTTDIDQRSKKYNETATVIDSLSRSFKMLQSAQKEADQPTVFETQQKRAEKLLSTVQNLQIKYSAFKNNSALMTEYKQIEAFAKSASNPKQFALGNAMVGAFEQKLISLGKHQRSFSDELRNNIQKMGSWMVLGGLMATAIRDIKGVFTNVVALDTALVDLQMATNGTKKETAELLVSYSEMAKELGSTTQEVAASASDWLRQGKSIADTNTLIRNSMILSKVGNIESSQSTVYLTAAMKGYKVAVEDTLGIVDKLSSVDMIASVSAGGLAEGMSEVANNADLAGVSMDKLLGYLAAVGRILPTLNWLKTVKPQRWAIPWVRLYNC